MKQIIEIPIHSDELTTDQITFNLPQKTANVLVYTLDENMTRTNKNVIVDIPTLITENAYTTEEISSFKNILTAIVAKAWGIPPTSVTDDILPLV